jgi:NDP-sugar pyrophosphorylase family protein
VNEAKGVPIELKTALEKIDIKDKMFVFACDNLFDFDLNKLSEFAETKQGSVIVLRRVKNIEEIKKYCSILLDDDNRILFFEEKPENPKSNIMSAFCYLLSKEDLELVKNKNIKDLKNVRNVLEFLHKESKIYGKMFEDAWFDIGNKEDLDRAEAYLKEKN